MFNMLSYHANRFDACCGAKLYPFLESTISDGGPTEDGRQEIAGWIAFERRQRRRGPRRADARILPLAADVAAARARSCHAAVPPVVAQSRADRTAMANPARADGGDSIEVTELARVAFLLGPSLSRILRDLEARDLIERRTAEADLSRGVVSISPKGLKLIEAVAPHFGGDLRRDHPSLRRAQARRTAGHAGRIGAQPCGDGSG